MVLFIWICKFLSVFRAVLKQNSNFLLANHSMEKKQRILNFHEFLNKWYFGGSKTKNKLWNNSKTCSIYMAKKFVNIRFWNLEIFVESGEQDSCYDLCPVSKSPSWKFDLRRAKKSYEKKFPHNKCDIPQKVWDHNYISCMLPQSHLRGRS
jgi:hypothetical protein